MESKQQSHDHLTLRKRPWRRGVTPFDAILASHYRGSGTEADPYVVEWLKDDKENPQTYSDVYKWSLTMIVAFATLAVSLASSAYSGAAESIMSTFHVSTYVFTLGITLFVVNFASGPLIWAPASEVFGRRNCFILSYVMFTIWNSVGAAAQNIESVLVFRFMAGLWGSYPLVGSGGTISDMFSAEQRGLAMAIFSSAPFLGPALGPITGGFIEIASGFRWVQGFLGLFSGLVLAIGFFLLPETYAPTLLRQRAAKLSEVTGKVYRAPMDVKGLPKLSALFKTSLKRPWILLFREPIVSILSLYIAIVYGELYMLFSAYPIVFGQQRGWNAGVSGLAFLGVLVGMLAAVSLVIFWDNPRYVRVSRANGGRAPPEARLPPAIIGSVLVTTGLAWFAGTCGPSIHWIVPIIASSLFGAGIVLVFLSLMNYLVDSYLLFAASVLAANSTVRSIFGAVFPLFTPVMYRNLGVNWASAIPAFLSFACLPFPILFYRYGEPIRKRCKFAAEAAAMFDRMMAAQKQQAEENEKETSYEADDGKKNGDDDLERGTRRNGSVSSDEATVHENDAERPCQAPHKTTKDDA